MVYAPALRPEDHESENGDADDHVQRVHAGHGEVEEEVELGVARHVERQRLVLWIFLVHFLVGCRIQERLKAVMEAGNVVLVDLLFVLDCLDAKEGEAEDEGEDEAKNQGSLSSSSPLTRRPWPW